ncbi:MAG: phosphoribosyltransferase family protein [Chloroflexota bacterium]|nr:phosphoribosyltransferase family protein [Dehalococcoidia bacterium]MDW8047063.1 phosphoribosyltransferase family protein [Chloroflexota bacterium]
MPIFGSAARPFADRLDAGRRLAEALAGRAWERPLVLGIPRGGVVVAAEVARRLGAELGVVVARKLRTPGQPELAMGAVAANGATFLEPDVISSLRIPAEAIERERTLQMEDARRREALYGGSALGRCQGRDVIMVDDGVATGSTMKVAVRAVKEAGARSVTVAVPVGPPSTIKELRAEADDVVCLIIDPMFMAVGAYYADFSPTSDEEVLTLLGRKPEGTA